MPTAPPTVPIGWDTVTLTVHNRPLTLPAEPVAPGLALVPSVTGTGWSGGYAVVHTASGKHIGPYSLPLAYARELAHLLGTGGDWTRPADQVRADATLRRHAVETLCDLGEARDFGLPLWWARPSWRRVPPPWLISNPTTGIPEHDDNSTWVADAWADVVALADRAIRDRWSPIADDATVRRADWPEWELVCAAPGCGQGRPGGAPAVLSDWADEIGDDRPLRSTKRAHLIAHARAEQWREHTNPHQGRHWLCPPCADDHPRDHN
ncbi:hypothetical protein [Saccharothrix deserti]|uniref:hypothetical protein n=1 Tax=Saccharothrix deserti TaxID=2593674 RepID=UPI00131DB8BD|nr:hypothetical protein [Saccharothrix deserti]